MNALYSLSVSLGIGFKLSAVKLDEMGLELGNLSRRDRGR